MADKATPIYKRRGVIIGAIAVLIPVIAAAIYLGAPLFFDRTVIEDFPRAAVATVPEDVAPAPLDGQSLEAETVSVEPAEDMPAEASPVALVSGEIMGADAFHEGTGTATIYELEDGSRILRLEDIDITNGPDLRVLLSPVADPDTREEVMTEGYIDLGGLKGNIGSQNYDIPADYELPGELSVVIYCRPFRVIFSTATLT